MIFRRAKLRLALSYALVQLALFAVFGLGIYGYVTSAFDVDVAAGESATFSPEASFATLRNGILLAYGALVIVIPATSYLLASLAMRPISASFEAQQRFVDDASHEFRTPLSALQAQLELGLRRPRTSEEYRDFLGNSLTATAQLTDILDDLIMLSRGAHDADVSMRHVDLGSIVTSAMNQLPPTGAARVRRSGDDDVTVTAAPTMLIRALVNLLTNALRYSPATSEVTIAVSRRSGFARITVEDRGSGMTRSEQALAFDRFWRADSSRSSEGRGLGLSIVKEIAQLHGGRIILDSTLGIGTIATLEIPLSR